MLSEAIDGFVKYKVVEGLSETTLVSYEDHLRRLLEFTGENPVSEVTFKEVADFLYWLRAEYIPYRITGNRKPLAPKTIYNIGVSLKSFFSWLEWHELVIKNPMLKVPKPKFTVQPVKPLNRDEFKKILRVCKYSATADRLGRREIRD